MTKRSTKRALLMSVLALLVCASMLVGTTFAWFTDSVTSANNKIQSGTLKIDLKLFNEETGVYESIKNSKAPIFDYDLWEPGYTEVNLLQVENLGTLALKWKAKFVSQFAISKLAEVIDVYVCPSATALAMPGRDLAGYTKVGTLDQFINTIEETTYGTLKANESAYLGIALKMQESAGNEYQNLALAEGGFDIQILATQLAFEEDSFDKNYDVNASYAYSANATLPAGGTAVEVEIRDTNEAKVASAVVPAAAIADPTVPVKVNVKKTAINPNITVAANTEAQTFDVTVSNLEENNTTPVKVSLRIPAGLDPDTVKLYHYETEIPCTYNPSTGYVTFESATFSPFTVLYDAESVYVPEPATPAGLPEATISRVTEYENVELPWGSYGQWSPSEELDSQLNAAFKFVAKDADKASESAFANWFCDFYVSLDKDLGENEIFLGGNYGSFGWVGFHNGDVTLNANEEIPLLGSVVVNDWTYQDIAGLVGEFICGVGDVDGKLAAKGATFTVMLRLTNPENTDEFYNVATIKYDFANKTATLKTLVNTAQGIQDAINNGADEIVLSGDIDLSQGLIIPGLN